MRPVSVKRAAVNRERKKALKVVQVRSQGRCEARGPIEAVDPAQALKCRGWGSQGHEPLKRSRGGSITDPANIVWVCDRCHEWTEAEPALATLAGLLTQSWAHK